MTSEPVQLVEYNPDWPLLYRQEAALVVDIQHIGSTAVQGLAAKPMIDIMVGLRRKPHAFCWPTSRS